MTEPRSPRQPKVPDPRAGLARAADTDRRPPPTSTDPGGPDNGKRPGEFATGFSWLGVGVGRNWRGVLGAMVSTYFFLPFALAMAAASAVGTAALVVIGMTTFGLSGAFVRLFAWPLMGGGAFLPSWLDGLLLGLSGPLGMLLGFVIGLVLGFIAGLLLPWSVYYGGDPLSIAGGVFVAVTLGLAVGFVYTLGRVALEGRLLRLSGARRMSRREDALLTPIVRACARRMKLANHPPILIDDRPDASAYAHTRHIVVCHGLLEEFQYDPEVLAGVLSHQLVHWRNGDPISAAFVRGVALPLYAVYAAAGWLIRKVNHPFFTLLAWLLLWPLMVTVRYVIMPLQAADTRRAEYRADQGAVLAGHRDGLRRVLVRLGHSFEEGRNGWEMAVGATHPPIELRLERLEDPSRAYLLPDPERAPQPLPAAPDRLPRQGR